MNTFSEAARSAYEQYLMGTETIENVLSKMIPGSKYYDYLLIIDSLKKEVGKKGKLSDKTVEQIKKFKKKHRNSVEEMKLDYQSLFIEFDKLSDLPKEQKILLEKLAGPKYLKLGLKLKKTAPENASEGEGEKSEAEEDVRKHELIYDHDDHVYKDYLKRIENETLTVSQIHPNSYFETFLTSYPMLADITHESFLIKCAEYFDAYIKKNKGESVLNAISRLSSDSETFYNRFTLDQLIKMGELCPKIKEDNGWSANVFVKKFHKELDGTNSNDLTNEDKMEYLKMMYKETEDMPNSLRSILLFEVLALGRKMDVCYKEYFMEYLKNPAYSYCLNGDTLIIDNDGNWDRFLTPLSARDGQSITYDYHLELLKYYFEAFYRAGTDTSIYQTYFNKDVYRDILNEVKFLNGEEINHEDTDATKYEKLGTQVMINILESNPKSFKIDDKIRILCDLKNTPTIYIKIYEFNAENYYRNKLAAFDSMINLDGLEPLFERIEEFKESPQKKFRHLFEINEIHNKAGLFVIDFISNGFSSRAVVKKGSLSLVTKIAREGHICYICDENKKICKTDSTAIWFSNKYFKADEAGKIVIPFADNYAAPQAVLLNNGIADLASFNQQYENYSFECFFNLHHESLLMGKNATIIITPKLNINSRPCSLSLINKCEVRITMKSFIDNLPMTKVFDNLEPQENKDLAVTFQVPPNLGSLEVYVNIELTNITKGINEKKTCSRGYILKTHESDTSYFETYLRRINGEYYFYLLGKTGEPIANADLDYVELGSIVADTKYYREEFKTDKEGKVKLGKLEEIVYVNISGIKGDKDFSSRWNLPYLNEMFFYPNDIHILEGEDITLPFPHSMFNSGCISLIKYQNAVENIHSLFDSIVYHKKDGYEFGDISINNLESGTYKIYFKKLERYINITVHKGVYWESEEFILKSNALLENWKKKTMKRIGNINIKSEESKTNPNLSKITFKVDDGDADLKIHAFASNTMFTEPNHLIKNYEYCNVYPNINVFKLSKFENEYLNNKKLNDELRYALERKYLKNFIGTTLERPGLLLKRNYCKDTYFESPNVGIEQQYQQVISKAIHPVNQFQAKMGRKADKAGYGGYGSRIFSINSKLYSYVSNDYLSFLNFLDTPPMTIPNISNKDGVYSITLDTSLYTNLMILAVDSTGATQRIFDLKTEKSEISNLRTRKIELDKPLSSSNNYLETRNSLCLKAKEKHLIEDITSVDYQTIDSIQKVGKVLEELLRLKHQEIPQIMSSNWIYTWNNSEKEFKNKKYSQHMCNEFNFFLYFKDREYFDEVVRPVVASKIEKTLIDYFLLEEYEQFDQYKHVSVYDTFNALEQCLLIAVINMTDPDCAAMLADQFLNRSKVVATKTAKKHQKFDTVLLMKILESDEGDEEDADEKDFSKAKKKKSKAVKRQRSMSNSSNSSVEDLNWNRKMSYADDDNDEGEGGYEGEGGSYGDEDYYGEGEYGGGGGGGGGEEEECLSDYQNNCEEMEYEQKCMSDDAYSSRSGSCRGMQRVRNAAPIRNNKGRIFEKNQKSLFREIESCKMYCETHYLNNLSCRGFKKLSKKSEFYSSFLEHIIGSKVKNMKNLPFLTCNFIYTSITFTDMMAVMALLDLPWQSDQTHRFDPSGERGIEIIPNSNMMIFKKELQNTEFNQNESIMVIHRFFDENNKNSEMKIEEFLQQRIYGCEVIITNVSSSSQELQCLWQIPEGSVPLKNSNYQKSNSMTLKPYTTQTYEFYFYFPKTGKYTQFPSNISCGDVVIAKSRTYEFKVVSKKDSSNFERFSDLALSGDKEAILNFLKNENLFALQLKFHMKHLRPFLSDKKFYDRAIKICRDRRIFGYDLWKFGFKHYDLQAVKELIETDDGIQVKVGTFFESSLIRCTPERNNFRYYDFFPMINSRAHKLDNEKSAAMLNVEFKAEYDKFLKNMIEKAKLNSTDHLFFCSYLLIQDRIEEALALFKKVSPKDFAGKKGQSLSIQYDYLQCYFDILVGYDSGFKVAREVCKKYEDYPVITWRMLFNEIIDQLKEFDGIEEHDSDIDLEDIDKKKENLKKSKKLEPTLDFNIEDKKCNIDYTNIESVTVKYYVVNPEILFTRAPFLIQNTEEFSYVKPVYQTIKSLPKKSTNFSFEINKDFENKNVIIEVDCGSKKVFQTYLSCALKVSIIENYAELKVADSKGAPIPQVYIKAFAKHQNGEIKFFKDGYTDMRGKFEYGYNNTEKLTNIEKLSILVMSEKFGSVIKECKLPTMVVKDADVEFLNARQAQKYRKWSFRNKKKEKSKKKK